MSRRQIRSESNLGLRRQLDAAFDKPPDAANILQGIRRMRTGAPHVRIVQVPSQKNDGRMMPCEGSLEEKAVICLELDPKVHAYRCQPISFHGPKGGRMVPDFAVRLGHDYVLIDIKPYGRLRSPNVTERLRWARRVLAQEYLAHYVFTDRFLEKQPYLQIRSRLWAGVGVDLTHGEMSGLVTCLRDGPLTVRELRSEARALAISPLAVERLALLEQVRFCCASEWNESTLIEENSDETTKRAISSRGTVRDVCFPL